MMKWILLIALSISCLLGRAQGLSINEFMSDNQSSIQDADGDRPDWIELHNSSSEPIDLTGYHLSDDAEDPLKWQFTTGQIVSGGFLIVFASDKDRQGPTGYHTNFKISSDGEALLLSNPQGELIRYIPAQGLEEDVSLGALNDGQMDVQVRFLPASPGASNDVGEVIPDWEHQIAFSDPGGFYPEGFGLTLQAEEGYTIRYTTDGSHPTADSPVYEAPITIRDRQYDPDGISLIPSGLDWQEPRKAGEKATVIKAALFLDEQRRSRIFTETYFISSRLDERYDGIPVIALSTPSDSLFSYERGIYVQGVHFDPDNYRTTGNYFMKGWEWERQMHLEFFDSQHSKQFAQDCGARIHGKSSRYLPQKTLRLYARDDYAAELFPYPFFQQKTSEAYKRILLRSADSDQGGTLIRDVLSTELIRDMEVDYMDYSPSVVFLNGEYWGIHNIRERIDEHYLAQNHGVDPDEVDLLTLESTVEEGSSSAYLELRDYVATHDLAHADAYTYVAARVDLSNLMDYYIAQFYLANFDWPEINIRFWRPRTENGKWRWILYDCDRCMLRTESDRLKDFILSGSPSSEIPEWSALMLDRLLDNDDFRKEFMQRALYHYSTTFSTERVLQKIDSLQGLYAPLLAEHIDRWNRPASVNQWYASIEELRSFAIKRPPVMLRQLMEYIGEQFTLYPNPVSQGKTHVWMDMEHFDGLTIQAELFDALGNRIRTVDLSTAQSGEQSMIPIQGLSAGFYILRIQYGSIFFDEKLIVQ
ncbi:MAG: T9SS type A sorting domain-containing protein [Flavobacteriales bacterium]|nr:T9SS type A sorting domain-containing protein [Flavobacteriales bacterium]